MFINYFNLQYSWDKEICFSSLKSVMMVMLWGVEKAWTSAIKVVLEVSIGTHEEIFHSQTKNT